MTKFSELKSRPKRLLGKKIDIDDILGKEISIEFFEIKESLYGKKNENKRCLHMQIVIEGDRRVVFTGSEVLMKTLEGIDPDDFPIDTIIQKESFKEDMYFYQLT